MSKVKWSELDLSDYDDTIDEIRRDWLDAYRDWLDEGVRHTIQGNFDPTETRQEEERPDDQATWDDFMRDVSDEWEPTYTSGYGKSWTPYRHLYSQSKWDAYYNGLLDWIIEQVGSEEFNAHEDEIRESVFDWCAESDFTEEPEGWEEIHQEWKKGQGQ